MPTNQFYYGVRYANNCHPRDLWSIYFTSSANVKKLIALYGKDSFKTEIRKTFNDANAAIAWEKRVTRKIISWPNCLNKSSWPAVSIESRARGNKSKSIVQEDGLTIFQKAGMTWKMKKNNVDPETGSTFAEIRKRKFNEALDRNGTRAKSQEFKKKMRDNNPSKRPEVKHKISNTLKSRFSSGQIIPHMTGKKLKYLSDKMMGNQITKGLIWVNDGVKDYRHNPNTPLPQGFKKGRIVTNKGHTYPEVTCPHCGKVGRGGNMTRFHFANCKSLSVYIPRNGRH